MRTTFMIIFSLIIIYCSNGSTIKGDKRTDRVSVKEKSSAPDTMEMLQPVPKELIVDQTVNDSDVFVVKEKCVLQCNYSENELLEIHKKSKSEDEWNAFYDDYSFYEDVTMFLYERVLVRIESEKKYVRFISTTGEKITIDRIKSVGRLFFFNPETGIKQCNSARFDRRKYKRF